jgi:hypothetical protein
MKLLIACLLIYHMNLGSGWYVAAVILWIVNGLGYDI